MVEKASTGNGKPTLLPAPLGNQRARTHGAFVAVFSASEQAEVAELAEQIRELVPVDSPSIEPAVAVLGAQVWRYRKLMEYVRDHGLHVGRSDRERLRPAAVHALDLEKAILGTMRQLGMTPRAAADLGLSLVKLEKARVFDFERLTPKERQQFDDLVQKAENYEGDWDNAA
jgi:hypothetical protein